MVAKVDPRVALLEKELTRVRGEFERAFAAIPEDRLHRSPAPDAWTPAQLLWHLAKIERGVARLLERLDASLGPMDTVPPGPAVRDLLKLLDQYNLKDRSKKFAAPEGLRPPEVVDVVAEKGRLRDGRQQLFDILRLSGPRLSLLRHDHVYFGSFDGWQWVLMIARHEERHLLQLKETLAATS